MTKQKTATDREVLQYFLESTTAEVFETFGELPNAVVNKDNYVWIPGTLPPQERLLLVAHADTVSGRPAQVEFNGNIIRSRNNGLGADDRAGVALMWCFHRTGHSILITNGEERGCVGARAAANTIEDALKKHLFAVEIDRRGDTEMVFYSVSTAAFEKWILEFAGAPWRKGFGSFTDIAAICPQIGICGVNLAAGYLYEHTHDEVMFLDAWRRTHALVERLVTARDLKKWALPKAPVVSYGYTNDGECKLGKAHRKYAKVWAPYHAVTMKFFMDNWDLPYGKQAFCTYDCFNELKYTKEHELRNAIKALAALGVEMAEATPANFNPVRPEDFLFAVVLPLYNNRSRRGPGVYGITWDRWFNGLLKTADQREDPRLIAWVSAYNAAKEVKKGEPEEEPKV